MRNRYAIAIALALAIATPVSGHHSTSIYDTVTLMSIEGIVTKFEWKNPHTYIQIETTNAEGTQLTNIEAGSISWLRPLGLAPDSFQAGDRVTVWVYPPARQNAQTLLGREIIKEDGTPIPLNSLSPYINRTASSGRAIDISGTWVMENGAWDRMEKSQPSWELTDNGEAALARHNGVDTPQSECVPMSVPNLMFYPVVNLIDIREDAVRMRIDWMDSERIIYTDGREHPNASQRFLHGHSSGRWEGEQGKLLVVETTNFADHGAGSGYGIPSGSGKRVMERFQLSDDGTQISYSGVLESPEYLVEPVTWNFAFNNRPDLSHSERGCDLENARRFEVEE
ncbi:MAG: DUF6152 family protein [Gammaproteobacteria bacterium]